METDIKEELIKSVNNIKTKLKMIKNEEDAANLKYKKVFRPITNSLETFIKVNGKVSPVSINSKSMDNINDTIGDLNSTTEYQNVGDKVKVDTSDESEYYDYYDYSDNDSNKKTLNKNNDSLLSLEKEDVIDIYDNINIPFGIRCENKKLKLGNSDVCISTTNKSSSGEKYYVVTVNNKKYEFTNGLKELLIRCKPNLKLVTEKDKTVYKELLDATNAHKRDFNPYGQIKGDKGLKYRKIIKPLFSKVGNTSPLNTYITQSKIGGSLPKFKKYKSNTDYIFWDDPNELIERLKLLIASKCAGNNNHDNEILSIIEELKEAKIIKE